MIKVKQYSEKNKSSKFSGSHFSSSRKNLIILYSFIGISGILVAYVFLISVGTWTNWYTNSTYYDELATSFWQGKLALNQSPEPALLVLSNPYDPELRAGIPYPQDVSLYKGKFYLYFGPVPALILTVLKFFTQEQIGDQYLVFGFAVGILLLEAAFFSQIMKRFLINIPPWFMIPGIFLTGLITPIGWMLSLGSIYNASILSGQFFFLSGFLSACSAFTVSPFSRTKLFLAGVLWACAIGSRMTQIIPVAFMAGMVLIWILYKSKVDMHHKGLLKGLTSFILPLLLGAVLLGWYNWIRFDSIFEFGTTYQLAGPDLQEHQNELLSPRYVPNNIYNYFLIKPELKKKFPFLGPVSGRNEPVLSSLHMPDIYFSQEVAGLLYIAPFIIFATIPLVILLMDLRKDNSKFHEETNPLFQWTIASLIGASLFTLLFFVSFFWAAVRYQAEFILSLALLGVIGFWQLYRYLSHKTIMRFLLVVIGLLLILVTILNSNLVALSINSARYREFNPVLWNQLIKFFNNLPIR